MNEEFRAFREFDLSREIGGILKSPDRKESLSDFKERLYQKRSGLMNCRIDIENLLLEDPDTTRETLLRVLNRYARDFGFTNRHLRTAVKIIDSYYTQRKANLAFREKYPDDLALVEQLTGLKVDESEREKFTVEKGIASLEIYCPPEYVSKLYSSIKKKEYTDIYGFYELSNEHTPPISYLVVGNGDKITLKHERTHSINKLYLPNFSEQRNVDPNIIRKIYSGPIKFLRHQLLEKILRFEVDIERDLYKAYIEATEDVDKKNLLREFMLSQRIRGLDFAKDEILAIASTNQILDPNMEAKDWTNRFMEFGPYDYFKKTRRFDDSSIYKEISDKVLVKEYRILIENAFTSILSLLDLGGFNLREIVAYFSDKNIKDWPKESKRLREQRSKILTYKENMEKSSDHGR